MTAPSAALPDALSSSSGPRLERVAGCLVFGGRLDAPALEAAIRDLGSDPCVLMHVRVHPAAGEPGRTREHTRTLLVTDLRALPSSGGSLALGIAAPREELGVAALDRVVEIPETPVVRASRSALSSLLREPSALYARRQAGVEEFLLGIMRAVLRDGARTGPADPREMSLRARLTALIEARHRDPRVDVAELARELHTSRRQLYRAVPDGGVAALLTMRRITTAQELLSTDSDLTIAQVAEYSGFSRVAQMRSHFLRETGVTPREYRQDRGRTPAAAGEGVE